MMQAAIPAHIEPLLIRHAEDAAFYWAQLDGAARAFNLYPERYTHFNRLLDAHLEGLLIAEEHGVAPALKALERWGQPGEAFVAAWLSRFARCWLVLTRASVPSRSKQASFQSVIVALPHPRQYPSCSGHDPPEQRIHLRWLDLPGVPVEWHVVRVAR